MTNNINEFPAKKIILASSSAARRAVLSEAGLRFDVRPCPDEEEERLKAEFAALPVPQLAEALADGKARYVSRLCQGAWTLGADQVCELEGRRLSKQRDRESAARQLVMLQGKTHYLRTAFAWAKDGETLVRRTVSVRMLMKPLSLDEIYAYLDRDLPYASAGSYCFELTGRDLFEAAEGTREAIMGLPLEEVLATLSAA